MSLSPRSRGTPEDQVDEQALADGHAATPVSTGTPTKLPYSVHEPS